MTGGAGRSDRPTRAPHEELALLRSTAVQDPTGSAAPATRPRLRAARRWEAVVALAALLPVCLVYLWYPGDADETLFELGAARLADGAVYYRDFWDIKQPGIYWLYQLGAGLGVGVVGTRLLEIAGALAGAYAVRRLAVRWGLSRGARVAAPTLAVGTYLLYTHHGGVAEIEGFAVPLLIGVTALVWPARPAGGPPRPAWRWFAAGLLAGGLGVLKVLYLPLPAVVVLGALVASWRHVPWRTSVGRGLAATLGVTLPLAGMVAYFVGHGAWRLFWVTTFEIPLDTVGRPVMDLNRHHYLEMGLAQAALLAPLALVAVVTARRRGTVVREVTLVAQLVVAAGLGWVQFPTPYRLLVLVPALGLLAVVGADVVWRAVVDAAPPARRGRRLAVLAAVVAVLALPSLRGPQRLVFAAPGIPTWGLGQAERNARDEVLIHEYASRDVEPVRALVRPGDSVYVIGHPQPYQLLGVREAVEIAGWGSALQPGRVWHERDRQLVRSRPRWVFVETEMVPLVTSSAPRFAALLRSGYTVVATAPRGTWYRTDSPGPPSGIPGDNQL